MKYVIMRLAVNRESYPATHGKPRKIGQEKA